jgi:hypothetical protein
MARAASQQSSILMFVSKSSARIGETPKLRYFIFYVASIKRNFVISSCRSNPCEGAAEPA